MYPQRQQYQGMDNGTLYHQPPPQPHHQPHHRPYPQQPPPSAPPEPLPSATDVHTTALSISQMAEFSSTMVYLMWHERSPSVLPLHPTVLHSSPSSAGSPGASNAFRKYCRSILQATQLSESVVLLSLKYIALLLRNNPQLRGAEGSEYRLYTVALMLANKFLDDNTFTNKTWSDISGMKMHELNVMEFEFLDVLRFALFIQKADFDHWKTTLFNFRSKLYDPALTDASRRGPQHQQLIETTLKNMGLPMQYHPTQQQQQQDAQWQYQQQEAARQQQIQQQQQQQLQQQQYNQHLYLLSKAQQPHIPPQQLNRPLTRVPLRIPVRPIYQTHQGLQQPSSSTAPGSNTATVYDPSIGVSITGTSATVIQPAAAAPIPPSSSYTPAPSSVSSTVPPQPSQQQQQQPMNPGTTGRRTPIVPSTVDNPFPATPYSSQQPPPPRIMTNPQQQRPYDYTRPEETMYPGQNPPPPSAHVLAPSVPSHANFYSGHNDSMYSQQQQQQQQQGQRTTSLPSAGLEAPAMHMNPMTSAPSASPFYYNTPSATPNQHHSPHGYPTTSNGANYMNAATPTYARPRPYADPQPTTPSSLVDYSYGDAYNRGGRPSYQNPYASTQGPPPSTASPFTKQPAKPASGPVPEDPMTAAESYRTPSRK